MTNDASITSATTVYTRRIVHPTATAEQLAHRLIEALEAIRSTYTPLVEKSTNTVIAGHGFEIGEQLIADLEHQYDAADAWLGDNGIRDMDTADGLSGLLIGMVSTMALDDALNEHSTARQARNAAHERWICTKYNIDPAELSEGGAV